MTPEPLALAEAAMRLAPTHCDGCAAYHGTWPLLRVLGIASAPAIHERFLRSGIVAALHEVGPRVLVSGAADEAMVALVREAAVQGGAEARVTVLDRCPTPLALARWWARGAGVPLDAVRARLPDVPDAGPFHVVCTHALFGYVPPDDRPALARVWAALLVPGGRLVTVNRLRPEAPVGQVRFSEAQADAFVREALTRAPAVASLVAPAELERRVRAYIAGVSTWPVRSEAELVDLLAGAGFDVAVRVEHVAGRGPTGPGTPAGARYALVTATRGR